MRGNDKVAEVIPISQAAKRAVRAFQPHAVNLKAVSELLEKYVCPRFFLSEEDAAHRSAAVPTDGESEYVQELLGCLNDRVLGIREVRLERRFPDETYVTLTTGDHDGRRYAYTFQLNPHAFADLPG